MAKVVTSLVEQDREHLLSNSFYSLPDNPSNKNFSAGQIKGKGYKPSLILYNWLGRLIDEINASFGETQTDLNNVNLEIEKIKDGRTTAEKAKKDQNGNVIDTTYETKEDATTKLNTAKSYADTKKSEAISTSEAYADEKKTEAIASAKAYSDGTILPSAELYTDDQVAIKSAQDRAYADGKAQSAEASAVATAEAYADDNKVDFTDVVDNLTDTSTRKPLSANQGKVIKGHIDSILAILQSPDTDLDTLQEIVAYIKNNKSLIESITTTKVNISDIIDNLTTQVANKPLSAKQGYLLKALIDALTSVVDTKANSSSVYTKTETYSTSESDTKFRTENQVDTQINIALAGVDNLNVINDQDNSKNYTWQIKIINGKAHFIATEVI